MPLTRPPGVGDTTRGTSVRPASPVATSVFLLAAGLASVATASPQGEQPVADLAGFSQALQDLARRVGPSVVQVFAQAYAPGSGTVPNRGQLLGIQRGSGSGVILDPEGYIITNAHVVSGARRIQVALPQTEGQSRSILRGPGRLVGAQLVGADQETDLAVLKVQEKGLPVLPLGDSDELRSGQLVLAFGSPLGLESSVTMGVVSAVARQLRPEDPMIYVQTDAPINPGSSGGALVDSRGRVVGINTLILSQSGGNEGVGFAAPSNIVRNVYEQIRAHGRVRRGEIGVRAQTLSSVLASGLGLSRTSGVVLADVTPGGPGAAVGLQAGDVVLALDGKPMENGRQLRVNLYGRRVGDTVTLEIARGDQTLTVQVGVAERPGNPARLAFLVDPKRNLVPRLGILGLTVDDDVRRWLPPLRQRSGVAVAAAAADSVGFRERGFSPGDVIHAVNREPVGNLSDLHAVLEKLKFGDPIVLHVERSGAFVFLVFTAD